MEYIEYKQVNQLMYLVNEKAAIVGCFNEMFDSLSKVFGGNQRCLKFYQVCIDDGDA